MEEMTGHPNADNNISLNAHYCKQELWLTRGYFFHHKGRFLHPHHHLLCTLTTWFTMWNSTT
jgi:hypothetical protein